MTTAPGITERNHAHEQADLHEILRLLAVLDDRMADLEREFKTVAGMVETFAALLEEFGPVIAAYRATAGGTVGVFRARKALRNGTAGI